MHDPLTVAFEIRWPIPKRDGKFKFYPPIITIWHKDPEIGGSDDSCGWTWPPATEADKKVVRDILDWDKQRPYFLADYPTQQIDAMRDLWGILPGDCLALVWAAWQQIAWKRDRRDRLAFGEWQEAANLAVNPNDNLRMILVKNEFSFRPREAIERVEHFLWCVMRAYLRYHRPWYRHPRWHIRHWQIQVHPVQALKRWLFSRCAKCGKRFAWGYSPICTQWDADGPRWFRSERHVYHSECSNSGVGQVE
jgi:hypothetical protein